MDVEHQTVEWWIEQLKEFNPKAKVRILTGFLPPPVYMASIYSSDEDSNNVVIIDVEQNGT